MKIYKLFHKVDGYKAINTKGTKLEESFIEYGNDIDFSKHEGDNFEWYSESTDKDCDFPFINLFIILIQSIKKFKEDNAFSLASHITYYTLLSFFPFFI